MKIIDMKYVKLNNYYYFNVNNDENIKSYWIVLLNIHTWIIKMMNSDTLIELKPSHLVGFQRKKKKSMILIDFGDTS